MEFLFNKTYNLYRSSPLTCYFTNELETIFTASNKHRLESTIESFIQSKLETTIPVFQTYLTLELPCLQTSLFNSVNLSTEQLYDGSIRLEEIKTWSKSYSNEQDKYLLLCGYDLLFKPNKLILEANNNAQQQVNTTSNLFSSIYETSNKSGIKEDTNNEKEMKVNIVVVTRLTKSQPLPQYHLVLSKGNTHLQSLCLRHLESSNLCRIHQFSLAPYQLNQVIQLVMEVVLKDFNHYNRDKKLLPAEFKFEFPNKYFNEGEGKQGINFVSLSIPWLDLSTIWRQIYYEIPTYKKEPKLISLELLERINCHFKTCIGIYLNDLIINRFASPCFIIQAVGKIKFLPTFPIKVYIQLLSLLCLLST